MNTPKTNFIFDSAWPRVSDQPRGQHDYLLMVEHARQLETQVNELREALEKIAAKGKYDEPTMNAGRMQQLAGAILEKTS